jgi:hypothetical protein
MAVLYNKKSLKIPKGGNQNPYIEEQTTQWTKEKVQKDKQRSTKHTHKTKDRVTRTPVNNKQRPTKHTHKTKDRVKRTPVNNKQ